MLVRVKLFATYREVVGAREVPWSLSEGAAVGHLIDAIFAKYPRLAGHQDTMLLAVNRAFANRDTVLRDGDEVALLPPVSGGAE